MFLAASKSVHSESSVSQSVHSGLTASQSGDSLDSAPDATDIPDKLNPTSVLKTSSIKRRSVVHMHTAGSESLNVESAREIPPVKAPRKTESPDPPESEDDWVQQTLKHASYGETSQPYEPPAGSISEAEAADRDENLTSWAYADFDLDGEDKAPRVEYDPMFADDEQDDYIPRRCRA